MVPTTITTTEYMTKFIIPKNSSTETLKFRILCYLEGNFPTGTRAKIVLDQGDGNGFQTLFETKKHLSSSKVHLKLDSFIYQKPNSPEQCVGINLTEHTFITDGSISINQEYYK